MASRNRPPDKWFIVGNDNFAAKTHYLANSVVSHNSGEVLPARPTAMLVAELSDVRRFAHLHGLMGFFGLVPREESTGDTRHLGAITKAGNTQARWILVEAVQSALTISDSPLAIHDGDGIVRREQVMGPNVPPAEV